MGCFIHDCVLKGLAHDSQIIHELLPIFKCKLHGCLKAASPSTSLGYLGGRQSVPLRFQSLHLSESCLKAIVLFPTPPPPGGGRAQHPPDPDPPSCRSRCRVQAALSQAKQNPAALTSCGTVTRPSATGFRTPPPRVPRPPMLVQTSPACTRTPGRGSALHAASPGAGGFSDPTPISPPGVCAPGGTGGGRPSPVSRPAVCLGHVRGAGETLAREMGGLRASTGVPGHWAGKREPSEETGCGTDGRRSLRMERQKPSCGENLVLGEASALGTAPPLKARRQCRFSAGTERAVRKERGDSGRRAPEAESGSVGTNYEEADFKPTSAGSFLTIGDAPP